MRSIFSNLGNEVLLPPLRGREAALRGRRLTTTKEQESIIINRPDRSTYPDKKSDNHLAGLHAAQESGGVKVKVRTYFDPTEAVCRSLAELICIPIIRWWS